MELSLPKLILILLIVLLLFGAGRLPGVMSDIGKGIRSLKDGLKGDEKKPDAPKQVADSSKDTNA